MPPIRKTPKDATAVIAAATGLATSTIAVAAAEALKVLHAAAEVQAKVVADTASKALSEFPRLQEDIREIRNAQQTDSGTTVTMVRELIEAHAKGEEFVLDSIHTTVKAVEAHMVKQNGRLDKAETHITRQNVAIFGVAGPVALIILGIIGRQLVSTIIDAERSGTLIDWPNIVMIGLGITAVFFVGILYFGYKAYALLNHRVKGTNGPV